MRIQLRDLAPGQQYAIQFRSNDGAGNVSEWSQVQTFTTTNDTTKPGVVQNLSFYNSGSSFIAQWDKLLVDEQNNALKDLRQYHIQITDGTTTGDYYTTDLKFEFTKDMNFKLFNNNYKTALTCKVWGVDNTSNESPSPASKTLSALVPSTPSTPTVGKYLGLLMVTWNGLNSAGTAMEANCEYAEVHVSTTSGFTPTTATYKGRVEKAGSASSLTVAGLTAGTTYYVRLVAVNTLGKQSGASVQDSGAPGYVTGLDITPTGLSPAQMNFTARDLGGANAYYKTSQPTSADAIGGSFKVGDIWYDTDATVNDPFKGTYRWDGTQWVGDATIGVISGRKILTETLTADAIATNFFTAYQAKINSAFIDSAMISTINASQITTGSLLADNKIIVGPVDSNHAELTSGGFYVRGPSPLNPAVTVDRLRLGTGLTDYFAIPKLNDPDNTLAQIDEGGNASFQALSTAKDPSFQGKALSQSLKEKAEGLVAYTTPDLSGDIGPIQSRYGLYQLNADLKSDRMYKITITLTWRCDAASSEGRFHLNYTKDGSAPLIDAAPESVYSLYRWTRPSSAQGANYWQTETFSVLFNPTTTATHKFLLFAEKGPGSGSMYIESSAFPIQMLIEDIADQGTLKDSGLRSGGGGKLFGSNVVANPPNSVPQNYYREISYDWVRSYKGDGSYMGTSKAYQGVDPYYGPNGNLTGFFGFNTDFTSLLSGSATTIQKIVVYLYYANWYSNAGGTALIGYHSRFGDPLTAAQPFPAAGTFPVTGWQKPGGREVDITGWASGFKNGVFRGIALGPAPSSSSLYYGYATDCKIKIWYTK